MMAYKTTKEARKPNVDSSRKAIGKISRGNLMLTSSFELERMDDAPPLRDWLL